MVYPTEGVTDYVTDLRRAVSALAFQHALTPEARHALRQLAGLNDEPAGIDRNIPLGLAILAAWLFGLGVTFLLATTEDGLSRVAV